MRPMNIFLCGVGGQGIGLLSDVLTRACLAAGYRVRGCDTHGLAQRHGTVVSHLRIGNNLFTPRTPPGQADVVVGLERLEAMRGAATMLRTGGTVVYYDTVYQPIHVRLRQADYPSATALESVVADRGGTLTRVYLDNLKDPRMQNVALLGRLAVMSAVEDVGVDVVRQALCDTVPPKVLDANLKVFEQVVNASDE
ncbi:MAG: 2-oxoacid:acceptor oxidoreductase family protein [Myxococcota bacterium]|nr:2-oxoacid:acceptor oxidoreductase family protein [Myxococcota bacterium]